MRILLVEDDGLLGDGFQVGLRQMGFQVDWVREGRAALRELSTGNYDACILDLGLPQLDGMEVLTLARAQQLKTPILILTARNSLEDRIEGLNLGADDYLIKPIDINELIARLRAISRRFHGHVQNLLIIIFRILISEFLLFSRKELYMFNSNKFVNLIAYSSNLQHHEL